MIMQDTENSLSSERELRRFFSHYTIYCKNLYSGSDKNVAD